MVGGFMKKSSEIGVILPVSFPTQLGRLDRTLFSLAGQSVKPEKVYVVCNHKIFESVRKMTLTYQEQGVVAEVIASSSEKIADLLNQGIESAHERYITFLQDGDLLYSNAYHFLKEKMITKNSVGISFSEIIWFESEVCSGIDYKRARRIKLNLNGKSWLEYYSQCSFGNCMFDQSAIRSEEWYFNPDVASQFIFSDFLARNGFEKVKNTENYNIPIGEKWFSKEKKLGNLSEFDLIYQEQWQESISEEEIQNFSTKRQKKKKVGLWKKILHTCRYLKYRLVKG